MFRLTLRVVRTATVMNTGVGGRVGVGVRGRFRVEVEVKPWG